MTEEKKKKILEKAKEFGASNLFATYEDFTQLQDYLDRFSAGEKAVAFTSMGLTVNTMAFLLAKQEVENDESTAS